MIQGKVYEMGRDGGLVESVSHFDNLPTGSVLQWGGNYGFPETRFCIMARTESQFGVSYDCFNMDDTGKNAHLHRVEASSIKAEDDPALWHSQHYFIQPDPVPAETLNQYRAMHEAQRSAAEDIAAKDKAESDRLEAVGRELWPALIGECPAVIVAERHQDVSDAMTDYFSSRVAERVILAPSKHTRDLFPEMRKAAEVLPETADMGRGKGRYTPMVQIGMNFVSNGSCYYEGARSHWHREFDQDEQGRDYVFTARAEAEAYAAQKGEPFPISFDGQEIPFKWGIREEEIEHREKYSMGAGYYLSSGGTYSGWHVEKHVFYKGSPQREDYICLAKRHDHLTGGKPAPKPTPAPSTPAAPSPIGYTVTHDRDWTWVTFPAKPAAEVLQALKDAGAHWGKRRAAWYFTRHTDESEIAAMIGKQEAPALEASTPTPAQPMAEEVLIPTEIFLSTETPSWEVAA